MRRPQNEHFSVEEQENKIKPQWQLRLPHQLRNNTAIYNPVHTLYISAKL